MLCSDASADVIRMPGALMRASDDALLQHGLTTVWPALLRHAADPTWCSSRPISSAAYLPPSPPARPPTHPTQPNPHPSAVVQLYPCAASLSVNICCILQAMVLVVPSNVQDRRVSLMRRRTSIAQRRLCPLCSAGDPEDGQAAEGQHRLIHCWWQAGPSGAGAAVGGTGCDDCCTLMVHVVVSLLDC